MELLLGILGVFLIIAIAWIWANGLFPLFLVLIIGAVLWFTIGRSIKEELKSSNNNHTQNKNTQRSTINKTLSVKIVDRKSYVDYLREFEHVVYVIANEHPHWELPVYVGISKTDDNFCNINFNLPDLPALGTYTFGTEFSSGDGYAGIHIERAVGFTTPEQVKSEILLYFDWAPRIPRRITSQEIFARGDFQQTPLISINLVVGPVQDL